MWPDDWLSPASASHLIDGFRSGLADAADLSGSPVLVVDVDGASGTSLPAVPIGFPGIVVAVGRPSGEAGWSGADVALTTVGAPPAPWVEVADVEAAVAAIQERVAAAPGAALTFLEVLRGSLDRSTEEGLIVESAAYSMLQAGPEFATWRAARPTAPLRPQSGPAVRLERVDGRLELTLNRPEVHNAYNRQMRDELCEALAVAAAEPGVIVSICGAGPSFCSGGDLDEFGTSPDPLTAHLVRTARSPARLLDGLAARTEVTVHGYCAGSGIELPAFAGRVRARPGTRIWLPEIAMGLIPGAGGTVSLPRRIGAARTAWMGLTGEPVDAETAHRWGLVDELLGEGQ